MKKYSDTSKVTWNSDIDNFDVLMKSDILISDYSGVMFEFAMVFDKPIIYTDTKFDPRPYDADWIDETPWTFSILPSLGPELNDENAGNIKELIDKCIDDKSYLEGRQKAREDIWVNIGESAKRSADFIIKKVKEIEDQAAKKAMQEKIEKKKQLEEKMKKSAKKPLSKGKEVKA